MLILFFLLFSNAFALEPPESQAVTYQLSGGRLGNNLIAYLHGKWIAENYQLPLLYIPFQYAEAFAFHSNETHLYSQCKSKYPNKVVLKDLSMMNNLPPATVVEVPYFREEGPRAGKRTKIFFRSQWNSDRFKRWAKELLRSQNRVKTVEVSSDRLNVLLHVRTGSGFDSRETQLAYPEKFPPHSFYISSLRKISRKYAHTPIYAYIMTDDPNPEAIAELYRKELPLRKNIIFDYRKELNRHNQNVIEDFYSIPKFDCLIRGDSTFAIVASLLADFKVVISPKKCHVEKGEIIVDEVEMH